MAGSFNILTDAPTLLYPNGGEIFTEGSINIQWTEPSDIPASELIWYEIFITDSFDDDQKPELLQIATIPSGNSSYSYDINKNLKSNRCRVGIRAVNHEGIRSKISFSADNFTITNKSLPSPALLEPITGSTYFSYIPIILDYNAVMGRCSQRAFYQIYYSSDSQDIDWTLFRTNIMIGSNPFDLDVSNFATASDYSLKIELIDDNNVSSPVFIDNVTINNINYFLIDTTPPKGSIKIVDNTEYIKETNVVVEVEGYDKTTDIKEFQIEQVHVDSTESPITSSFYDMTPLATWDVQGEDGVKLVQVRFKDYGDNVIASAVDPHYFRTYKSLENKTVSAFLYNDGDLYIAFSGDDNTSGDSPQLYKNLSLLSSLSEEATALEYYNGVLYIAVKDEDNKGILQRFSGGEVESVVDNEAQYTDADNTILNVLYYSDSVINCMEVFDDKLFMGTQNGQLLSFNGSTITTEHETYLNVREINQIKTDNNILYIYFSNSVEIMTMNKDANDNYVFTIIDTGS